MPYEFSQSFRDTAAFKFCDVEVVAEHGGMDDTVRKPWPGSHRNVYFWVELANGRAVGWNENPGRGWSFPVVKLKKD
jgi:hypothetical protein